MKKLFFIALLPFLMVGCTERIQVDVECQNGILLYEFTKSQNGFVDHKSSGIFKYKNGSVVKCVME